MSTITCIHGLEATACKRCKPVRPKRRMSKPKPRPAKQPTRANLFDAEAQARLEQAMQSAREAAHAGTLLSKQLGKKPRQLAAIRLANNG